MGMSTHVKGIIPKDDEEFQGMKIILETCIEQEIHPPREVLDYFDLEVIAPRSEDMASATEIKEEDYYDLEEIADKKGVIVKDDIMKAAIEEYSEDMGSGYDVDIRKLPFNIKIIRFYNSW